MMFTEACTLIINHRPWLFRQVYEISTTLQHGISNHTEQTYCFVMDFLVQLKQELMLLRTPSHTSLSNCPQAINSIVCMDKCLIFQLQKEMLTLPKPYIPPNPYRKTIIVKHQEIPTIFPRVLSFLIQLCCLCFVYFPIFNQ